MCGQAAASREGVACPFGGCRGMCGCRRRGEALQRAARIVAAADGQGDGGVALGVRISKKPKSMRFNFAQENLPRCLFALSQVDWVPVLGLHGRSEL